MTTLQEQIEYGDYIRRVCNEHEEKLTYKDISIKDLKLDLWDVDFYIRVIIPKLLPDTATELLPRLEQIKISIVEKLNVDK